MILQMLLMAVIASTTPAAAKLERPASSAARLAASEKQRMLAEVKLAEEIERADAQNYLTRLELGVTKQRLAAALAKCGAPCVSPANVGR